jgi:hypothetical protein
MIAFIVIAALTGLAAAWFFATLLPGYLLYATPLVKADAVVLFLGQSNDARPHQVDDLVAGGWAKFVIVPYKGQIFETFVSKSLVTPEKTVRLADAIRNEMGKVYVERTHVELAQTLALMKHIGATRAIFVSSPYHMRRIHMMADRLFDPAQYELAYVPTSYDPPHQPWFASWTDVKWVFSEYLKIIWYFVYSPFV